VCVPFKDFPALEKYVNFTQRFFLLLLPTHKIREGRRKGRRRISPLFLYILFFFENEDFGSRLSCELM
jgi:hypothetical protein